LEKIQWFVMRAYKCERQAEEKLAAYGGMEYFIPKHYAVREYHGVKSRRLVPVIPSLVFVRSSRMRISEFKKGFNQLQYAMCERDGGLAYMTVPDDQMANFIKVASQHEEALQYFRPEEIDLRSGARVRILGGCLDGVEGVFVRVSGRRSRRVVVMLDGVMAVAAEVRPDLIEVLSA